MPTFPLSSSSTTSSCAATPLAPSSSAPVFIFNIIHYCPPPRPCVFTLFTCSLCPSAWWMRCTCGRRSGTGWCSRRALCSASPRATGKAQFEDKLLHEMTRCAGRTSKAREHSPRGWMQCWWTKTSGCSSRCDRTCGTKCRSLRRVWGLISPMSCLTHCKVKLDNTLRLAGRCVQTWHLLKYAANEACSQ